MPFFAAEHIARGPPIPEEFYAFQQYIVHDLVFKAVKDDLPETIAGDDAQIFQIAQLMRNSGLVDVQHS